MIPKTFVAVVALFASLALLVMGNSSLGTIAALRLEIEGFEPGTIGLVLALGFCIAGLMLVIESWINSHATNESRGAVLATYMVLFFLAASSRQFIVMLGDPGLHQLFVVAAIFFILSLVPISLTRSTPPVTESAGRLAFAALWARSELGLFGAAGSGLVLGAFGAVGPVYGYEMGLEVDQIAAFMGISILAAMVIQWPMGFASDYLPRRLVIVSVAGAAAGLALFTAAFGQRSWLHL